MIPNRLVFIWIGDALPMTAVLAIRSAWLHCQPDETVLLHEGLTAQAPGVEHVASLAGFRLHAAGPIDFELDCDPSGEVQRQFAALKSPASRANLLRLAYLYRCGGIYLDTDTLTIRDLGGLRDQEGFCGLEPVLHPFQYKEGRLVPMSAWRRLATAARGLMREACARSPGGVAVHRLGARSQVLAVNNAVIGATAGNSTLRACLERIGQLPPHERSVRFRLGTHLMQEVTGNVSSSSMTIYPAEYFYPLGPVLSLQYFRTGSEASLPVWLGPRTHVVHWYSSLEGSVHDGPIDSTWIARHPTTAFAALAQPHLPARSIFARKTDEARLNPSAPHPSGSAAQ